MNDEVVITEVRAAPKETKATMVTMAALTSPRRTGGIITSHLQASHRNLCLFVERPQLTGAVSLRTAQSRRLHGLFTDHLRSASLRPGLFYVADTERSASRRVTGIRHLARGRMVSATFP
jgi:hypothetical protein